MGERAASCFEDVEGVMHLSLDLRLSPREMREWPALNIEGVFRALADAIAHVHAAREHMARQSAPLFGGAPPEPPPEGQP